MKQRREGFESAWLVSLDAKHPERSWLDSGQGLGRGGICPRRKGSKPRRVETCSRAAEKSANQRHMRVASVAREHPVEAMRDISPSKLVASSVKSPRDCSKEDRATIRRCGIWLITATFYENERFLAAALAAEAFRTQRVFVPCRRMARADGRPIFIWYFLLREPSWRLQPARRVKLAR
jgi:hypothetical protein